MKIIKIFISIFLGTFAVIGALLLVYGLIGIINGKERYVEVGIFKFKPVSKSGGENERYDVEYISQNNKYRFTKKISIKEYEEKKEIEMKVIGKKGNEDKYNVVDVTRKVSDFENEKYSENIKKAITGLLLSAFGIAAVYFVMK